MRGRIERFVVAFVNGLAVRAAKLRGGEIRIPLAAIVRHLRAMPEQQGRQAETHPQSFEDFFELGHSHTLLPVGARFIAPSVIIATTDAINCAPSVIIATTGAINCAPSVIVTATGAINRAPTSACLIGISISIVTPSYLKEY
jgi:hypothetical protein